MEALAKYKAEEEIWYDIYPLISRDTGPGIGRVGSLDHVMDLKSFALMIKKKLRLEFLKFAGDPGLPVNKAAVCTGSGSSLMPNFIKSGAQAYISGDMRYHDARDVQAANLGIIDIGHFPSEYMIVDALAETFLARWGHEPLALSRATVLLPTRRACRTLGEAFLRASGGRPLLLPRIQPLIHLSPPTLTTSTHSSVHTPIDPECKTPFG